MINVITGFGHSFKGCGAYLGHDIGSTDTSERVAWTHTHNLATDDPEFASKIMAATAMSQAELKANAGIKNTGRKSNAHVLHYVLSWHPEEREELTKDEMLAAALGSMSYIGTREGEQIGEKRVAKRTQYLDEHQAVIYCHDDGPDKPLHVHVMANRVHPEHGVMVSDSKDYEKLSAWAMDYRREQGKAHYCPQRTKNAAKRAQGVLTSHPRKPRNVYETEKAIEQAEPGSRKKAQLEELQRKAKALKTRAEAMKRNQAEALQKLEAKHIEAEKVEKAKTGHAIKAAVAQIRAEYAPKIDQLTEKQAGERQAFDEARSSVAGRVRNTWKALQTKEWMRDLRTERISAVTEGFKLAFSSGMQERQLENFHTRERGQLNGARTSAERDAAAKLRGVEAYRLGDLRSSYIEQRNDVLLMHGVENAKLKAEWQELVKDRLAVKIEDEREQALKAEAERGEGSSSSGGKQPSQRPDTPLAEQTQDAATPPPSYDIPIDELRALARDIKQQDQAAESEHDQDQSLDRE